MSVRVFVHGVQNPGLFHFHDERGREEKPDILTPTLEVGDRLLRRIIRGLYYPESPYEFSVLPVDVLGQVYELYGLTDDEIGIVEEATAR